jgi:hypothetical protein
MRSVTLRGSGPILDSSNSGFRVLAKLQSARLDRLNPPVNLGDLAGKLFGGSQGGFQSLLRELRSLLCGRPPIFGRSRASFGRRNLFSRQLHGLSCLAEESDRLLGVTTVEHGPEFACSIRLASVAGDVVSESLTPGLAL